MNNELTYTIYDLLDENSIVLNTVTFEDPQTPATLGLVGTWIVSAGAGESVQLEAPYSSWVLDENGNWGPPSDKPYPEDYMEEGTRWYWNVEADDWVQAPELEPEA